MVDPRFKIKRKKRSATKRVPKKKLDDFVDVTKVRKSDEELGRALFAEVNGMSKRKWISKEKRAQRDTHYEKEF